MKTLSMVETVPLRADASGTIRVGRTRVTLDSVVEAYEQGATAEEIAIEYPVLSLAEIYSVLAYYLRNRVELAEYLRVREEEAERIRKLCEAKFNLVGLRERLLARPKVEP